MHTTSIPYRGSKPRTLSERLGLFAAATAATLAMSVSAHAAVVVTTVNIPIPQNIDGIYVNLVTGASGTTAVAGYDINPYSSGTGLAYFFGGASAGNNGGLVNAAGTAYADLTPGTVVGPSGTFSANAQTAFAAAFQTAGTHTLGVRFTNESTGAVNYGYVNFVVTGSAGFPSAITGWAYENTGAAITYAAAVPEPTSALMLLGGGLALAAAVRRRKAAAAQA